MSRFSSHIEGPRWANAGNALDIYSMKTGTDIKKVVTKYLLRERIDFVVTGSEAEVNHFKNWLRDSVQEYNR